MSRKKDNTVTTILAMADMSKFRKVYGEKESINMECYIDYLNAKDNFRETRKEFVTYQDALNWMKSNFEKWDIDMIKYL